MRSTLVYKGCSESLEGADPARIHRMRFTLVYRRCNESKMIAAFTKIGCP